ncbi:uncharacterized protein TM35_000192380, partial [Trypanosoma theileri]
EVEKLNEQLAAKEQELEQLRGTDEEKSRAHDALNDEVEKLNKELAELQAENEKLRAHDDRWVPEASRSSGRRTTSHHRKEFDGEGWDQVLESQPEELTRAFVSDVADACRVDPDDVKKVVFSPDGKTVEFDVNHDEGVSAEEVDRLLQRGLFRRSKELLEGKGPFDNNYLSYEASDLMRQVNALGGIGMLNVITEEFLDRIVLERAELSALLLVAVEGFDHLNGLHLDREAELLEELEEQATEHTDMLEKMEEMVVLLEEARQTECSVRNDLFAREEELLELQRFRDEERRERDSMLQAQHNLLMISRNSHEELTKEKLQELTDECLRVEELEQQVGQLQQENASLKEEMARRAVSHKEALDILNSKIAGLMVELEVKGMEYTDTLGKLEEFVVLLEAARAAEKSALLTLEQREQELFDLQAAHNEETRELECIIRQLEARLGALQETQRELSEQQQQHQQEQRQHEGESVSVDPQSSGNVGAERDDVVRAMRQQLERLKREKEALTMELEVKGRQHDDAMDVLNRNIGDLMSELDSRIRGFQVSATSAKEMLREIALLRSAEEEEEEDEDVPQPEN